MLLTKRLCGDLVYYWWLKKKIQIITEARTVKNGKPLLKLKLAIMLIDYNDKNTQGSNTQLQELTLFVVVGGRAGWRKPAKNLKSCIYILE